ncbi:MAG: UbiA family prenyltransferase [Candidatus Methanoperedens sp.]
MNYLRPLVAYLKMFRFYNLFLPGASGLVGATIASFFEGTYNIERIFAGTLIPILFWGAGQVVNNYFDQYADRINHNQTSIVKGDIGSNKALYTSLIITAILIIISFRIDILAGIISIVGVVAYFAYCIKLKGIPLIGNTWFGFATSLCVLFGSAVSVGIQPFVFHPVIWIIFGLNGIFQGGHVLIGYFKDVKGDEEGGYKTLCVVFKNNLKAVALITLIYTIVPVFLGLIAWLYHGGHCIQNANYLLFQIFSLMISLHAQIMLINNPSPIGGYASFSMHKTSVTLYFLSWLASFIPIFYAVIIMAVSVGFIEFSKKNTKTTMQL